MARKSQKDSILEKDDLIELLDQLSKNREVHFQSKPSDYPLTDGQAQQLARKIQKILKARLN